jgi:hypothetical protein
MHADNLFAAFVQCFSRLLAGIFFLHESLTTQIIKSSFINRAGSIKKSIINFGAKKLLRQERSTQAKQGPAHSS